MTKPTETEQIEPETPSSIEQPQDSDIPIPSPTQSLDPLTQMTELAKRTQANFENYRKQTEKRIEDIRQFASKDCIMQLLPIIDNFKLALETAAKNPSPAPLHTPDLLKGIELIYAQLHELLEKNGVKPIPTLNQLFNPHLHEALMKAPSNLPENTIIEEFQAGYTMHDRVIRTARVKISTDKTQ